MTDAAAGSGSASAVVVTAAAAATCATASSICAVVGADCCMPSSAPRITLITTVQAKDTPATAAGKAKDAAEGARKRVRTGSACTCRQCGGSGLRLHNCCTAEVQALLTAGHSPKGMRRWRGTTLKLTSCAGTQMVHSALQLSHSSVLYFS